MRKVKKVYQLYSKRNEHNDRDIYLPFSSILPIVIDFVDKLSDHIVFGNFVTTK